MRILCIFCFLSFIDTLFLYFRSYDHYPLVVSDSDFEDEDVDDGDDDDAFDDDDGDASNTDEMSI